MDVVFEFFGALFGAVLLYTVLTGSVLLVSQRLFGWRRQELVLVSLLGMLLLPGVLWAVSGSGLVSGLQERHEFSAVGMAVELSGARWIGVVWMAGGGVLLGGLVAVAVARRLSDDLRVCGVGDNRVFREELLRYRRRFEIRREVALRTGAAGRGPYLCGLIRPTIVLPPEAARWSRRQVASVFAHELAHLRRHDLWWNGLAVVCTVFFWWNPVVWWWRRAVAQGREFLADACAVELGGIERRDYARALVDVCDSLVTSGASVAMGGSSGRLEDRVRALCSAEPLARDRRSSRRWSLAVGLSVLGVALGCAALAACGWQRGTVIPGGWTADEIEARFDADPFPAQRKFFP